MIRLLFIGDVVGRSGRAAVLEQVPLLRARWELDFVIVNGENAAGGFGLTETLLEEFLAVGVDAVTLGNHAFDQREALVFIERQPRLIRPVNFPIGTPGRGATVVENAKGTRLLVVNVMGRIFMDALDDPFAAVKRELALCPLGEMCDAAVVDFHAEASSEKWALAHFVDGKASLIVGTHTHTPSADHRILAGGTGNPFFTTDTGAALRAAELSCDAVMKATQVDGIYSADPKKDPTATRFDRLSHDEAIARKLQVMDTAAFALARDNDIPIVVFSVNEPGAIPSAILGKGRATYVMP